MTDTTKVIVDREQQGQAPLTIVLLAVFGGFVGFVLTLIVGGILTGRFTYLHGAVALAVVGAGFGWLIGAGAGLAVTKASPPRTRAGSWALLGTAGLFLLAGFTFRWWSVEATPPSIHHLRSEALELAVRLDAVLAAVTCVALAQRRVHRPALVLGAIVAIGIAVASAVFFFTGPCALETRCPGPKM